MLLKDPIHLPEKHLPEKQEHFLKKRLTKWTLSRMCISLNLHLLECTFP